jgi:type VI secretion system protein ImpG
MNLPAEHYLERELAFIANRQDPLAKYYAKQYPAEAGFASLYAKRYPSKAGQLERDANAIIDPHSDRFIQAFALLAGRVHRKIDEEFPQLTEAMLGILYPHLLMPIPSMTIAQFAADPERLNAKRSMHIPRDSSLVSRPVGHPPTPCLWRTGYPVDLWPVELTQAIMQPYAFFRDLPLPKNTLAVLRLDMRCDGNLRWQDVGLDRLRLYFNGDREIVATLYELIFNNTLQVLVRDPDQPGKPPVILKPQECLFPVGFELHEGLIPFPCESFVGYRLLTEFFHFPHKFCFLDLGFFPHIRNAGFGQRAEVFLFLNRTREEVARSVELPLFQTGCTPIINVFSRLAEPIALTHQQFEYKVFPQRGCAPNGIEVYSVDEVSAFDPETENITSYQPFYSFAYDQNSDTQKAFWYASRRENGQERVHTQDVFLVLVNQDFDPHTPARESVNVHVTCTNGELPYQFLRVGDRLILKQGDFSGDVQLMQAPTAPRRQALQKGSYWRWLTQTALGHPSLSHAGEVLDDLKETLRLCSAATPHLGLQQHTAITQQILDGITGFSGKRAVRSVAQGLRSATYRGMEFTLELDRQKFVGIGAFLFACVLERFLGLYTYINSFSQLRLNVDKGQGFLKQWPPRAAEHPLV